MISSCQNALSLVSVAQWVDLVRPAPASGADVLIDKSQQNLYFSPQHSIFSPRGLNKYE